jgi:hypothetical protein
MSTNVCGLRSIEAAKDEPDAAERGEGKVAREEIGRFVKAGPGERGSDAGCAADLR